jgi:hypothetical protein
LTRLTEAIEKEDEELRVCERMLESRFFSSISLSSDFFFIFCLSSASDFEESAAKRFNDEVDPNMVQVYGTKLASTVHYIQKLLLPKGEGEETPKILVFSQFNNFLHKFGYLLGTISFSVCFLSSFYLIDLA